MANFFSFVNARKPLSSEESQAGDLMIEILRVRRDKAQSNRYRGELVIE